jgi:hypothetical protein
MKKTSRIRAGVLFLVSAWLLLPAAYAQNSAAPPQNNKVLGEVQLEGQSRAAKTSGVWIDGQYVGYLKELKGSNKLLLLPGKHTITVRQNGYQDFSTEVLVQPGHTQVVPVTMEKAPMLPLPKDAPTIAIAVNPSRSAVFLDGRYIGHAGELWPGMIVPVGKHNITIACPGYQTFETQVDATPNQTVEIRTDLLESDAPLGEPLIMK